VVNGPGGMENGVGNGISFSAQGKHPAGCATELQHAGHVPEPWSAWRRYKPRAAWRDGEYRYSRHWPAMDTETLPRLSQRESRALSDMRRRRDSATGASAPGPARDPGLLRGGGCRLDALKSTPDAQAWERKGRPLDRPFGPSKASALAPFSFRRSNGEPGNAHSPDCVGSTLIESHPQPAF
jgi:hypothetical protein